MTMNQGRGLATNTLGAISGAHCAQQSEQKPAQPGLISMTADSLIGRADRVSKIADRLLEIGDRVYGSQPAAVAEVGGCSQPRREAEADKLHYAMEYLDNAIERLESGLPRVEML